LAPRAEDVSDLVQPRDDLRALEGYHSPQVDVAVRLNTNESPFAPPAGFLDEWTAALRDVAWNRYPDRAAQLLRDRLGAFLGQPAARLLCANGSNEVLQTILLTYGGAGRRALVFEPTYALHAHIARITGTELVVGSRGAGYALDVDVARQLVRDYKPSIIFVCTPNNPTGTVEPRETVLALSEVAASAGALLVVDEAYGEFAPWSAIELVDEALPLVVVRTYSKVWSLAAARLGFGVGPTWVIEELEKVLLPYALSVPTQLAGTVALGFADEMERRVAALVEERGRLFAALQEHPQLEVCPSGANFVLFRVNGDAHGVWEQLLERGVLVRDFSRWPGVEESLRVTIGTPAENDAFLATLAAVLGEVTTGREAKR
jgi:histidinol-phosphate aminotransferase